MVVLHRVRAVEQEARALVELVGAVLEPLVNLLDLRAGVVEVLHNAHGHGLRRHAPGEVRGLGSRVGDGALARRGKAQKVARSVHN